jgi:hypothetical protein
MTYVSLSCFQHPRLIDYPPADHCVPGGLDVEEAPQIALELPAPALSARMGRGYVRAVHDIGHLRFPRLEPKLP